VVLQSRSPILLDPEDAAGARDVRPAIPSADGEAEYLLGTVESAGAGPHALELDEREPDPGVVVVVAVPADAGPGHVG
jgi:hypothetical protein